MKPSKRKLKKWRKKKPAIARGFSEKRNRNTKHIDKEIKEYTRHDDR